MKMPLRTPLLDDPCKIFLGTSTVALDGTVYETKRYQRAPLVAEEDEQSEELQTVSTVQATSDMSTVIQRRTLPASTSSGSSDPDSNDPAPYPEQQAKLMLDSQSTPKSGGMRASSTFSRPAIVTSKSTQQTGNVSVSVNELEEINVCRRVLFLSTDFSLSTSPLPFPPGIH